MASTLTLKSEDDDPWEVARDAFDILAAYAQPGSTASPLQTAIALDGLSPYKRELNEEELRVAEEIRVAKARGEEGSKRLKMPNREESGSFLREFWETFLLLARQVPSHHPSQDRLVQLAMELNTVESKPSLLKPVQEMFEFELAKLIKLWHNLGEIENWLQYYWADPRDSPDPSLVNLNAFTARLYAQHNITMPQRYYFCLWTVRDTLERPENLKKDVFECRVQAAAQWMKYAAPALFKTLKVLESPGNDILPRTRPEFKRDRELSMRRWLLWERKFGDVGKSDNISDDTRTIANQAVENMQSARSFTARVWQALTDQSPQQLLVYFSIRVIGGLALARAVKHLRR